MDNITLSNITFDFNTNSTVQSDHAPFSTFHLVSVSIQFILLVLMIIADLSSGAQYSRHVEKLRRRDQAVANNTSNKASLKPIEVVKIEG